ncbi:hypothetical protein [Aneurinibacillus thermoaerophilus]|uniref:hypothetical protein n=1 Tax=Aneurinibacillus thermoaerophilus TaxID=143495 RepID=UPI002E1D44F6|nr:hypothetical protein [Aneurinibacillus thermoaerophilus]
MRRIKISVVLSLALLATACGNQAAPKDNAAPPSAQHAEHAQEIQGTIKIPGYNNETGKMEGSTVKATSYEGKEAQNTGMSVYSLIGSSSLHEGGISAHLQSRLASGGVEGVKVLVLDDTVILGRTDKKIVSTSYDPMQNKLLNGTSGNSATGIANISRPPEKLPDNKAGGEKVNGKAGTSGTPNVASSDNMEEARRQIASMFDGNVRILKVEQREAVAAMDRIKKEMQASSPSAKKLVKDISLIIRNASE